MPVFQLKELAEIYDKQRESRRIKGVLSISFWCRRRSSISRLAEKADFAYVAALFCGQATQPPGIVIVSGGNTASVPVSRLR